MAHPPGRRMGQVRRRQFLITAGRALGLTMTAPFASFAQETRGRIRRIGWIELGTPASFPARLKAFHEVLQQAGFIEGQNLLVDYRYAGGKVETVPALAAQLVGLRPECLVATGIDPINAVRRVTSTIPIVMG